MTAFGAGGALLAMAEAAARRGEVRRAVEACHAVIEEGVDDSRAHCILAECMLSQGFYDEAIRFASLAIEVDPTCAPAFLTLGLAYDRQGGMWDQSILVWHELAEVVPGLVTAHVQLGEAFAAAAFEREAIASWKRALELDQSESRAMYNLSVAALKREGVVTALPGFRKAGELDPSQDDMFFWLAGVYDDGEPAPDPASVAPDRASRLSAAYAHAFEDDYFSAANLLRLVFDEDDEDAAALGLAAYLYLKQEAVNEAMACSLRALTIAPRTPTAVYCLGAAFAKRPGYARHTVRVFAALARAVPDHPIPHVLHAEALLALQRYRAAQESYRVALGLDPACVRARFGLAATLLTEGRHVEAEWEIRRAAYHDTRRRGDFWILYGEYQRER